MEILQLFSPHQPSRTPDATQSANCADSAPRFILIPASRLPAKRILQGFGAECVFVLAGLFLAWVLAPKPPRESTNRVDAQHQKKTWVTIYYPRPAQKRRPGIAPQRAKKDEPRRFSLPPKSFQAVVAPALEPPSITAPKADLALPTAGNGFPAPPTPAPALAILQIRTGVPKALPILDPSLVPGPHRASSLNGRGANPGPDPLGSAGTMARTLDRGPGAGRPPDLSAEPPRAQDRLRPQPVHAAFTKPAISFMPKPTYPPNALEDRIEGDVSIEVTFDRYGHVIFRRFVRQLQNADLNSAARESVERIKFIPAMRDGVPVDQNSVVTVFFRLSHLNMTASF
jgi:TonB family protein